MTDFNEAAANGLWGFTLYNTSFAGWQASTKKREGNGWSTYQGKTPQEAVTNALAFLTSNDGSDLV